MPPQVGAPFSVKHKPAPMQLDQAEPKAQSYAPSPKAIGEPKFAVRRKEGIDRAGIRCSAQYQLMPSFADAIAAPVHLIGNGMGVQNVSYRSEQLARGQQYKPYTLQDYKDTNMQRYTVLGGLGPNVGGEDWRAKKAKLERMTEYARGAQRANVMRLLTERSVYVGKPTNPGTERAAEKQRRMADYAKRVPKPRQMGLLEELEEQAKMEEEQRRSELLVEAQRLGVEIK